MDNIELWTQFRFGKGKQFLGIKRPKLSHCKNICCKQWKKCIEQEACISVENYWEPIREKLTQEGIERGSIVTLDCYFSPPNCLNAGLVDSVKEDVVEV